MSELWMLVITVVMAGIGVRYVVLILQYKKLQHEVELLRKLRKHE